METAIVLLIVGAAVIYFLRNVVKTYKGEGGCNCGKTCESSGSNCSKFKEQDLIR